MWSGTGMVIVPLSSFRCITTWLPRLLTSAKPYLARMSQTAFPERTLSLAKSNLDLCHIHLSMKSLLNFLG